MGKAKALMTNWIHAPLRLACALSLAYALSASAGKTERYKVVKIESHDESVTYEIMTGAEYDKLQADVRLEHRLHSAALKAAKTAWRDTAYGKRSFPSAAIQKRALRTEGSVHMNLASATREKEKLKQRLERRHSSRISTQEKSSLAKRRTNVRRRTKNAFDTSSISADKNRQYAAARTMYVNQLNALIKAKQEPAEGATDADTTK